MNDSPDSTSQIETTHRIFILEMDPSQARSLEGAARARGMTAEELLCCGWYLWVRSKGNGGDRPGDLARRHERQLMMNELTSEQQERVADGLALFAEEFSE